ncbi:MAG: hypothetical protein FWE40_07100 [Oscillospiraceae bacterium]|nr:hypothetical protein [Oscillospiraceae bacterium]
MARNCFGIGNQNATNTMNAMLGIVMLMGLLGFNRAGGVGPYIPYTPYTPYLNPQGIGDFFIGDFRDVSEIESIP